MLRESNEMEVGFKLEPRVSRLEGELGQLISTVSSLAQSTEKFHRDIGLKLDRLAEGNRPNFGLLAQWTGVLVVIIGLIASPIAYHFNKSIEELDIKLQKEYTLIGETLRERQNSLQVSINELDTRLQREFIVANNNTKSTAEAFGKSSDEARFALAKQIEKLDYWITERIRGDLEELRARRLKDKQ